MIWTITKKSHKNYVIYGMINYILIFFQKEEFNIKTIAIVTNSRKNNQVSKNLTNDLTKVFENKVNIKNYYLNELIPSDSIIGDVILVMLEKKLVEIKNYINSTDNVIVVERTILEKSAYDILNIPSGTKVLIVNDCYETSIQTLSTIYQLGINHLQLIPFNENDVQDTSIKIAITPGEKNHVPSYIENILDIGQRCLDTYTLMKIMNVLKLEDKSISQNLIKYSSTILDINAGLKEQYKNSFLKNEILKTTLEKFDSGVLIVDNNYNIIHSNFQIKELFNLGENSSGNIKNYLEDELFNKLSKMTSEQELLILNEESFMVSKSELHFFGEIGAYFFNFNPINNIKALNEELTNKLVKKGFFAKYTFSDIIHSSKAMQSVITIAKKMATTDYTTIIYGESGTGKEIMAQAIHNSSKRKNNPFVAINCAALPENLLESELFGYEKGAFTGANKNGKLGLFEQANYGTIFLDEIGDMSLSLQSRLLRVLQERQIMRIGSDHIINIDVRIIAATNRNLPQLIKDGKFRQDLYYRLNILPINLPPLRERKEDILLLFKTFIEKDIKFLNPYIEKSLVSYEWPGNIRELINCSYYFKLMKSLPPNIFTISKEIEVDWNKIVLEEISIFNSNNSTASRTKILNVLKEKNLYISENNLRTILNNLKNNGYIIITKGRKGTEITEKGIIFLG